MAYIQLSDIGITGVVTAVPKNKINNNDLTTEFGEKHIHKFFKTDRGADQKSRSRTSDGS